MTNRLTSSVAIATYNGEKYIGAQLDSIFHQTVRPDEIVICDDRSTDNTIKIIEQFALEHPIDIYIHINENNMKWRKNLEKCMKLCKGDIVFSCDQDDVWVENKVERILKEFQNPKVVFSFSDGYVTDSELNKIRDSEWMEDWTKFSLQEYFDYCQTRNFPLGHLQAVRREVLLKITPFLADPDGWIAECAPAFGEVRAIPEKLIYYRRHSSTVSTAFISSKKSYFHMIQKMWNTSYQEYFTWPAAELITNSKVYEYIEDNGFIVKPDRLLEHLDYLKRLTEAEKEPFFRRRKKLKSLYGSGIYQQYRGNKKTYILDSIFMLINSFTKK